MKTFVTDAFEDKGRFVQWLMKPVLGLVLLAVVAGCQTQPPFTPANQATEIITLREGDVLKVSFPGSANLNTTQPIRRDGMISMPLIGEVKAVGKTPEGLKKELIDLYSTQLVSKEVTVEVQSSLFPVYVNGAVLHPGKIMSDHPMTAFDAIMEAGGFDYTKANLKRVVVIRQEGGRNQKFTLNLKLVMDGKPGEPFYVKPGDTITVPEKFQWF
jgi:polysaccharide export outer membrane protein